MFFLFNQVILRFQVNLAGCKALLTLLFVWSWGVYLPVDRGCRMMAQTEMKTETSINSFSEEGGFFFPAKCDVFFLFIYRLDANISNDQDGAF